MQQISALQSNDFNHEFGTYPQYESSKSIKVKEAKIGDLCTIDDHICQIIQHVKQPSGRHGQQYVSRIKAINLKTGNQVNKRVKSHEQMLLPNLKQLQFEVFDLDKYQNIVSLVMKDKCLMDISLPEKIELKSSLISVYEQNKDSQMVVYFKCIIIYNDLKIISARAVDLFNQENEVQQAIETQKQMQQKKQDQM